MVYAMCKSHCTDTGVSLYKLMTFNTYNYTSQSGRIRKCLVNRDCNNQGLDDLELSFLLDCYHKKYNILKCYCLQSWVFSW